MKNGSKEALIYSKIHWDYGIIKTGLCLKQTSFRNNCSNRGVTWTGLLSCWFVKSKYFV